MYLYIMYMYISRYMVCIYVYICTDMFTGSCRSGIYIYTFRLCIRNVLSLSIHIYIYTCMHVCVYIYIYIHTHTL